MSPKTKIWLGAIMYFVFVPTWPVYAQTQTEKTADKKFWVVNTIMIGSTIYDVESTYFALNRCENCYEANPLMKPFVEAGRPALYIVQGAIDVGIIYASYKMKKKGHKLWYVLPAIVTVAHTIAGTHNIRIAVRF